MEFLRKSWKWILGVIGFFIGLVWMMNTNSSKKVKKIKKPFARKIQILTVGEQRAKVMGKNEVVNIFKKGKESLRRSRKNA